MGGAAAASNWSAINCLRQIEDQAMSSIVYTGITVNAKAIGMANASVVGLLLQRKRHGSAAVNAVAQKNAGTLPF